MPTSRVPYANNPAKPIVNVLVLLFLAITIPACISTIKIVIVGLIRACYVVLRARCWICFATSGRYANVFLFVTTVFIYA